MEDTISKIALGIAILALIIGAGIGFYVYFEPEITIDLEEIGNKIDSKIDLIKIRIDDIVDDIKDLKKEEIDLDDYLEVDDFDDEVENLEELIEDNEDDIDNNADDIDDILDCADTNITLHDCLNS